jgi:uncharacterized protein YndB with AHSA1/START domain
MMTETNPGGQELVIERVFNAPSELVWKAWTEPERLAQWWGPKGFALTVARMDFRPGGDFLYSIQAPNGFSMWGKFVYHEISAPERMVFVSSFCDEHGNVTRNPMSATWPLEVMNILTLSEIDGKTTLTIQGGPYSATEEEHNTFFGAQANVKQGFKGTFDQLEAYLAEAQKQ